MVVEWGAGGAAAVAVTQSRGDPRRARPPTVQMQSGTFGVNFDIRYATLCGDMRLYSSTLQQGGLHKLARSKCVYLKLKLKLSTKLKGILRFVVSEAR